MIEELGSKLIPVVGIICTFVFLTIWLMAATVDSLYKTSCKSKLKNKLVDHGFSATEIDRILRAGDEEATEHQETASSVPPMKQPHNFQMPRKVS